MIGTLAIAWQWLLSVALTFWIGILVIEGIVFNSKHQRSGLLTRSRKQVRTLQWLCLSVLFVAEIIVFILRAAQTAQSQNGNALDPTALGHILFQSSYGFLWIAQVVLTLGALGLLWWITNRQKQPFTITLLILAGLILTTYGLSANAAQPDKPIHIYAIVLEWFSSAAQCIWFGGLAYLGYILLPIIEPDRSSGTLTILLRRFHPLMLAAICVLFASELYLTTTSLSNTQQFISEPYGRALLVEWILVLIMTIFSVYTLFVLRPKLTRQTLSLPLINGEIAARKVRQSTPDQTTRSFQKILRVQAWLGAAVLLCAVLIAFYTPPASPNTNNNQNISTGTPSNTLTTQTKRVGNLSVMLTVTPGKIDVSNTVTVKITDTRSDEFVTNARVVISTTMEEMNMGTGPKIMTGSALTYTATFAQYSTFSMTGYWDIMLTIQVPQQAQDTMLFTVWLTTS